MDFISNILKRPITLVRNDSGSSSPEKTSPKSGSPISRSVSGSPLTTSLIATAMNTSIHANMPMSNGEFGGSGDWQVPRSSATVTPPLTPRTPAHLTRSTSSNSSTTSNTIEELLLQINDNLNSAYLCADNETTSLRSANKTTASQKVSPVSSKTQAGFKSDTPTRSLSTTSSSCAVSGCTSTDVSDIISTNNVSREQPEFEPFPPDDVSSMLNSSENSYQVSSSRTLVGSSFTGLAQFDESKYPNIPINLHADIEEQLKLTFEEGIKGSSSARSDISSNIGKNDFINIDNNHNNKNTLSVSYNRTEICTTPLSSDNEIFAECLSYRDINNPYSERSELSETELFCSAVNSNNTTTTEDPLNETMENIPDMEQETISSHNRFSIPSDMQQSLYSQQLQQKLHQQHLILQQQPSPPYYGSNNALYQFEDEPMDVDITMEEHTISGNKTLEANYMLPEQHASPRIQRNEEATKSSELLHADEDAHKHSKLPVSVNEMGAPQQLSDPLHIAGSPHIELENRKRAFFIEDNKNDCVIGIPPKTPTTNDNVKSNANDEQAIEHNGTAEIGATPKSISYTDNKHNASSDMNLSINSSKSLSLHSPNFPVKENAKSSYFPCTLTSTMTREMSFLEKSDYTERKESTTQRPSMHLDISGTSPCKLPQPAVFNLNSTVNISSAIPLSPTRANVSDNLNYCNLDDSIASSNSTEKRRTFNVYEQVSPSASDSKVKNRRTFDMPLGHDFQTDKRLTFDVISPVPDYTKDIHSPFDIPLIDDKRRTFDVPPSDVIELQEFYAAMDIDDSLLLPYSKSSQIPTLKKSPFEEESSEIIISAKNSPTKSTIDKRQSIHPTADPFASTAAVEILSAKERTKCNTNDEKDIFVEKFVASPLEQILTAPSLANEFGGGIQSDATEQFIDSGFDGNLILHPSDFDYLLTKGNNNNTQVDRSSLLLKFDPLLGIAVPVQKQKTNINNLNLTPTIKEEEHSNQSFGVLSPKPTAQTPKSILPAATSAVQVELSPNTPKRLNSCSGGSCKDLTEAPLASVTQNKHATMSVDVINDMNVDNDCNKTFQNSNLHTDEKQNNFKMDELEKKIKNEVLKTEDIEKKLKDAEQREESLIKRITDKDKTISKMNGVIEAYEKAIAELIADKEQLIQNYDKQLGEIKADRDSNYHHLTSLETTFSDLHVKYEKSKDMTSQLKTNEEALLSEKRQNLENLRLQEQRYEKMKNHAMQQLEIANKKLESMKKEHAIETTKLKAQLKKEEISRCSINEQLQQKSRENEELVKICDELINGQGGGPGGSV